MTQRRMRRSGAIRWDPSRPRPSAPGPNLPLGKGCTDYASERSAQACCAGGNLAPGHWTTRFQKFDKRRWRL